MNTSQCQGWLGEEKKNQINNFSRLQKIKKACGINRDSSIGR